MFMNHSTTRMESYSSYKAKKFEKNKVKISRILRGIKDTSLKPKDQKELLKQIKEQVNKFEL